jgi:hypothetical protein
MPSEFEGKPERATIQDVIEYVEQKLNKQQEIRGHIKNHHAVLLDLAPQGLKGVTEEIERFKTMKTAIEGGECRGVLAEIGQDLGDAQRRLEADQDWLRKGLLFPDDERYLPLKEELLEGEGVLKQVTGEENRAWVERRMEELRQKIKTTTGRGQTLVRMEKTQREIDRLSWLKTALTGQTGPSSSEHKG